MSLKRRLRVGQRARNGSPRIARRRFLIELAAAGLATGAHTYPVGAQEMTVRRSVTVGSGQASLGESLGETLAQYAIGLNYEDLPQDVIAIAKRTILDTLGCAFGGYAAGPSRIAIKLASDISSREGATVLISGIRTSPDLAVFANGVMIRYLDFNDAFVSLTHGGGHPSDMIAALLSAAELKARSGHRSRSPTRCSARSQMSLTISATASTTPPLPALRPSSAPAA
jgi:hypothetical protein